MEGVRTNATTVLDRSPAVCGRRVPSPASIPVRVVIPAYRAEGTLGECVRAAQQSVLGRPVSVVVVLDGGGSLPMRKGSRWCRVREVCSPIDGSAAAARNFGAADQADGILVFLDADVIIDPGSVEALVAPIIDGRAEATVGNYSNQTEGLDFLQKYKQLYIATVYGRRQELRNEFWTAIGAVRADVFHGLGGFDSRLRGACGEDTELGQRLSSAGYRILAAPAARGRHLRRMGLGQLMRNDFVKGKDIVRRTLSRRHAVTDNRHASGRDMLAVGSVGGIFVAGIGVMLGGWEFQILLLLGSPVWFWARFDLLRVFAREGWGFVLRAIPIGLLLDAVRGLCVVGGVWEHLRSRYARAGSSRQSTGF